MKCEKCDVEAILVCPCCDQLVEERGCEHLSPDDRVVLTPESSEVFRPTYALQVEVAIP